MAHDAASAATYGATLCRNQNRSLAEQERERRPRRHEPPVFLATSVAPRRGAPTPQAERGFTHHLVEELIDAAGDGEHRRAELGRVSARALNDRFGTDGA